MAKLCIVLMLSVTVPLAMPVVVHGQGQGQGPDAMKNWYRKLPRMKPKVTELRFYLHDILSVPNPTNVPIAVANFTHRSPTYFGVIGAIDDLLTAGPSPNSGIVGWAQGLLWSISLNEVAYHMTFNIVFTAGKYNGSTIALAGHNPFANELRELPIVGSSCVFKLARGSALLDTVMFNNTTGDAIVEYNVMVLHY